MTKKNKYPIMCRVMFILTVVVANWISVYIVLELFDYNKVQQVLKELK